MSTNTSNALQMLSIYSNSDESDEEVPIGRVSTKRCFREESPSREAANKRTRNAQHSLKKLPVPALLQSSNTTEEEDPSLHDGKIRSFPHERGNWATYVYLPFAKNEGIEDITSLLIQSVPEAELKEVDDFHISVSRTVILKYHWIPLFIESLQKSLSNQKRFVVMFGSLQVYCNDEGTRTFVGFLAQSGYDTLVKITEGVDTCLKEFNLPIYYKDPSFHMSICWCLGDRRQELTAKLEHLEGAINEVFATHDQNDWYILVTEALCKTGNKCFTVNLQ